MAKSIAVIEFGTSKIVCATAKRDAFNVFSVETFEQTPFSGIKNGKIVNLDDTKEKVFEVLKETKNAANKKIRAVYVGVPACFCKVGFFESTVDIDNNIVTAKHMEDAVNREHNMVSNEYKLLSAMPVYFKLDDGQYYLDPENMRSSKMTAGVSYIVGEKSALRQIYNIFYELNIAVVKMIPDFLAEGLFMVPPHFRDEVAAYVNCGKYDTNVSILCGDAVIENHNISIGGEDITRDLSRVLKIDLKAAEKLKKRFTLGMSYSENDYEYIIGEEVIGRRFSCDLIEKIIESRVEQLAEIIYNKINKCVLPVSRKNPVIFSGGGLILIRGVKEFLIKNFNRKIHLAKLNYLPYDSPSCSTIAGMMHYLFSSGAELVRMNSIIFAIRKTHKKNR
ncbi:MAG: hypothetical protein R2876_01410 [Eubacteriales bacterium]